MKGPLLHDCQRARPRSFRVAQGTEFGSRDLDFWAYRWGVDARLLPTGNPPTKPSLSHTMPAITAVYGALRCADPPQGAQRHSDSAVSHCKDKISTYRLKRERRHPKNGMITEHNSMMPSCRN
jgi:hypothetical protein